MEVTSVRDKLALMRRGEGLSILDFSIEFDVNGVFSVASRYCFFESKSLKEVVKFILDNTRIKNDN